MSKGKQKNKDNKSRIIDPEKVDQFLTEEGVIDSLKSRYMPYAMSVIVARALPSIDGFKPSQRKLLYTMYKMGLLKGARTKSANIVGATMHLNPHGDSSIYEAMVRLGRGCEALLNPYIDSKGNFGKFYSRDMSAAASRYTEAKLDSVCKNLFDDIDKDTVDMVPNYDGTTTEPSMLPVKYPTILSNNTLGIAVGMACNICSFNLSELCNATIAIIDDEKADIMEIMPAPDFIGGGSIIENKSEIASVYHSGKGAIRVRGKAEYNKKNNSIEITEIPPTTTSEAIIEKIIDLAKSGKMKEISDVRDETDLDGLRISVDLKRGQNPDDVIEKIFKLTSAEDTFSCNFNVLIDGSPIVLGVNDILINWINFRILCIRRRLNFELDDKSKKLHLLHGLEKILLDIDKAISIIRESETEVESIKNLMEYFDIDDTQAEYVVDLRLRSINKKTILNRLSDVKNLEKDILRITKDVKSDKRIKSIIKKELSDVVSEFGIDRKTKIISIDESSVSSTSISSEEDYPVTTFISKEWYVKKVTPLSLRMSGSAVNKLKDGDEIIKTTEGMNSHDILLYTSMNNIYKVRCRDIADTKISVMGDYIPSIAALQKDERIIDCILPADYSKMVVIVFSNGKCLKLPLSVYSTKQNRKKLINAISDKQTMISCFVVSDDDILNVVLDSGKSANIPVSLIPLKNTKNSIGVQCFKFGKTLSISSASITDDGSPIARKIPCRIK